MATNKGEIYLCNVCGNKVEVLEAGFGVMSCCGKPMLMIPRPYPQREEIA